MRDAAAVLVALLLLGVACGVLWSLVVTPAEFTKLSAGGAMSEDQLSRQFGADGWYVVIATVTGAVAGAVLTWWRSRDPLLTSGLLVLGAAVAAAAMEVVGHLLGPGDPGAALAVARLGASVPERLDVDAFLVYLSWPVGVLAGALFALLGSSEPR
jgi:hypothetical protein